MVIPARSEPWLYTDVDAYVKWVLAGRLDPDGQCFFFLTSSEGEFWALGDRGSGFSEIIPGAGEVHDGSLHGDILATNWVGRSLYAVGAECQVHRRRGRDGQWELRSGNILNELFFVMGAAGDDPENVYLFRVPNGRDAEFAATDHKGQILHSGPGGEWKVIWDGRDPVSCGPYMLPSGEVVIGGLDGRIIQGDAAKGFAEVSRGDPAWPGIVSLAAFADDVYASD